MKKSKKVKKEEIVEISKAAFKNSRHTSKTLSQIEVIRKVVDGKDSKDSSSEEVEDRNPDIVTDEDMQSIETISEDAVTSDEEAIQIYRDVLSMSEEDKNVDDYSNLSPVRIMPPPPPSWSDNPDNLKFKIGEFVRYKGFPGGSVYKVVGNGKENNSYSIKGSKARDSYTEDGEKLVKVKDKKVDWVDYWSQHPVIPAPKPWLKKK